MGKATLVCVFLVFALLLEDGSSVRKKTVAEEREDKEIEAMVNRTLAEEEKRWEEDEKRKKQDEQKNRLNQEEGEKEDKQERDELESGQGEACLPSNFTCPVVTPCQPCKKCMDPVACPDPVECPPCEDCVPCRECGPCPREKHCPEEKPCLPCRPCSPCPSANHTSPDVHLVSPCPEPTGPSMSVPVAMLVGACASLVVTGLAATVGLLLRYVSPIVSGFIFVATIVIIWYLCSHYPETARELGGRVVATLREATIALSHRIMEAIRHHNDQVGFSLLISQFEFHVSFLKKFALRFSM
jgi:hypothetical protein